MATRPRPEKQRIYAIEFLTQFASLDISKQAQTYLDLEKSKDPSHNFLFFAVAEMGRAINGINTFNVAIKRAAGAEPHPSELVERPDRDPLDGAIENYVWQDKAGDDWPLDDKGNPIMILSELVKRYKPKPQQ